MRRGFPALDPCRPWNPTDFFFDFRKASIAGRTEEMLLRFWIGLTLSVAVHAASALGRYATIVQARDITDTSAYDFVVAAEVSQD